MGSFVFAWRFGRHGKMSLLDRKIGGNSPWAFAGFMTNETKNNNKVDSKCTYGSEGNSFAMAVSNISSYIEWR